MAPKRNGLLLYSTVALLALAASPIVIAVANLIPLNALFTEMRLANVSGAAVLIWMTGETYLKGVRSSLLYHTLLSLAAIWLILFHAYGERIAAPLVVEGFSYHCSVCSSSRDSLNPEILAPMGVLLI